MSAGFWGGTCSKHTPDFRQDFLKILPPSSIDAAGVISGSKTRSLETRFLRVAGGKPYGRFHSMANARLRFCNTTSSRLRASIPPSSGHPQIPGILADLQRLAKPRNRPALPPRPSVLPDPPATLSHPGSAKPRTESSNGALASRPTILFSLDGMHMDLLAPLGVRQEKKNLHPGGS